MFVNDEKEIIVYISEFFNKIITNENGKIIILREKVDNLLTFILNNFMLIDDHGTSIIHTIDKRNLMFRRLNWFYSKLLLITVHDEYQHSHQIRKLIDKMLQRTLNSFMYWFKCFADLQLNLLNTSIVYDLSTGPLEINIPGSEMDGNLNFSKIVIETESQLDNIVCFSFQSLSRIVDVFPASIIDLNISMPDLVSLVFINRRLECKAAVLLFCGNYYKNSKNIEFIDVSIKVFQHIANIYEHLNEYIESRLIYKQYFVNVFLKAFHNYLEKFIYKINSSYQSWDAVTADYLIASLMKLVFFESKWIHRYSIPPLTHWFTEIINAIFFKINYDENVVKHINIIKSLCSNNSDALNILKYKIVVELEQAKNFNQKVRFLSETWSVIENDLTVKTNYILNNEQLPSEQFTGYLKWIKDAIQITFDVDFHFTRRHQTHHCLHYICQYDELQKMENTNSLYKFNDWSYDHISFDYFDNLPSITHKLTYTISKRNEFTADMITIIIELFSLILQIPSTAQIKDDKKLFMLSMVVSPFLSSLETFENLGKSSEYIRINSHLNTNMKKLLLVISFDVSFFNELKVMTINSITRLKLNKLGRSFEWLNFHLMRLIFKTQEKNIQKAYTNKFINLLISNFDTMSTFMVHYQNIRMNNTKLELDELKNVLCLHDKNVVILKTITSDYFIYCSNCEQDETSFVGEIDKQLRWRSYITNKTACIISADHVDRKEAKIQIQQNLFNGQDTSFHAEFIKNIPACIRHSKSFMNFCQGNYLYDILFKQHEDILAQTDHHLKSIIICIQTSNLTEDTKTLFFEGLIDKIFEKTTFYCQKSNETKSQYHIVNMIATFGMNVRNNVATYGNKYIPDVERVSLKCLKMLLYFIILNESDVKGLAVNSMFRMLEHNSIELFKFINWYKTNIIEHITKLCLLNSVENSNQSAFLNSFINVVKFFNYQDIPKFLKTNIDVIISSIFVYCVHNHKVHYVYSIIDHCGWSIRQTLEMSSLTLYEKIYDLEKHKKSTCIQFISREMHVTFKELFYINRWNVLQDVLIKYSQNPMFVIDVIKKLGDENVNLSDDDNIANYISSSFLAILNNFERILNSGEAEIALKQAVFLSLGELIRFLGGRRISNLCFKIMSLLRTTVQRNNIKLKELNLSVWKILIFNCDISSLGPFLSQIVVALESYIDDFMIEVEEICINLIIENSNLLSTHISDLFFIEKTKFNDVIKSSVLNQIESQRVTEGNTFDINLNLMINHLKNEHADSNVKIYCLQYLEEFIRRNRNKFNNLIFDSIEMSDSVKYLLDVLSACSKIFHNNNLLLQTAKCFGELGAVKPALKKKIFLSKGISDQDITIHCNSFALKLLTIYCSYYKDMKETRYMESVALGIQAVLQERKVHSEHIIWKSLPEFTKELFKPLLNSSYVPRDFVVSKNEAIFWNQAQTPTSWAHLLSGILIKSIDQIQTRSLLRNLLPSMRDNQEISSILLPRVILHYLESNTSKEFDDLIFDEFKLVFKMVMDNTIYSDASKDELNYKFVANYDFIPIKRNESEECQNKVLSVSVKTAKMIFDVWDFLTRYLQTTENLELAARIESLQKRFSKKQLAEVSYKCGEYARAMILFESYIKTLNKIERENELPFLVNIYAKLRDSDLIEGVKALRLTEWSFSDKIFISEITGNLEGTFSYIEMMMKESKFTHDHIQTIINCYIQSNQNSTALLVADQLLEKLYESNKEHPYCDEVKAEALWRLSKFDQLDELLSSERVSDWNNWNVICGKLLTKFRLEDHSSFWRELDSARMAVMHSFKISDSEEAIYEDNYNEIFHLHNLSEFEKFQIAFEEIERNKEVVNAMKVLKNLIQELDSRKLLLQTTMCVIESSLSIRRSLLFQFKTKLTKFFSVEEHMQISSFIEEEIGKTWIECIKIACKQRMFAQAHAFMMEAENYQPQELFIEKAKYYWMKDEKASALRILELKCTELEKSFKNNKKLSSADYKEKSLLLSRGRLNIARYNAEVKNVDFDANIKLFKDALLIDSYDTQIQYAQNEEIYVLVADYMDRHYFSQCGPKNELPAYDKLLEIMEAYGSSMKYGMKYVLQSMPRFLQIWFDSMTSLERRSTRFKTRNDEEIEMKINNYVRSIVNVLKPYYFYTAFSQLISRLCHPSISVYQLMKIIIIKLIDEYPLESMWFLVPHVSSKSEFRKKRANEILNSISKEKARFHNFNNVMSKIMSLENRNTNEEFMDGFCSSIDKLFKNVGILMPLQKHLQMVQASSEQTVGVFVNQVLICRLDKKVEVMHSLQKPKKITFIGSDGKEYPMLLKFKDDLRIDFRYMEFLKVINDYFNKDAEASQRCLKARTYSVMPWNDEMGIIEWVPNLNTYKGIITDQYKKLKIKIPTNNEIKKLFDMWTSTKNKVQFFRDMKAKFPPVLGKWYLQHFSNVQSYFSARQNYIRSVAITSIVGYILGLGDRHMENILFDIHSGEVVHVDFNCVFNKGETLGYPETVPFRLTQAMIEAMGPLGIEGPFRKCCEVALQLMQREKNTLVSYLRPFIYDPMIRTKKPDQDKSEIVDSTAMVNLENVEKKLKGIVKKYRGSSGIALSSEGQVKFIIDEAISDDNLAIMWFHWSPYI